MKTVIQIVLILNILALSGFTNPSPEQLKSANQIWISGTVHEPKTLKSEKAQNLHQALTLAGGPSRLWNKQVILLRKTSYLLRTQYHYNFRRLKDGEVVEQMKLITIQPGDRILFSTHID
jgi:protein involved in polysaccharide export with SLBB domain